MTDNISEIKKGEKRYDALLTEARANTDLVKLISYREGEGYVVEQQNPNLYAVEPIEEGLAVEYASFKVKKGSEEVGEVVYFKSEDEKGAISTVKHNESKIDISYVDEGQVRSETVNPNDREETDAITAKIKYGTCLTIVATVCGGGASVTGTIKACLKFCGVKGGPAGMVFCYSACALIVGGGCAIGADAICRKLT